MLRVITVRSTRFPRCAASARAAGARISVSVSAQASARRVHEVMATPTWIGCESCAVARTARRARERPLLADGLRSRSPLGYLLLEHDLVAQRDPVLAGLGDLGLEPPPGLVDRAGVQLAQAEAAALVEAQ